MIDEALAVGDEVFTRRSDERIGELQEAAGTIFIVSHGLGGVIDSRTRVLWMDAGRLIAEGEPGQIVERYREQMADEVRRGRRRRRGCVKRRRAGRSTR